MFDSVPVRWEGTTKEDEICEGLEGSCTCYTYNLRKT
jgi:uncharacterized cupin superfamily protein